MRGDEVEATVSMGRDGQPELVHHVRRDLSWDVVEVIRSWRHPTPQQAHGEHKIVRKFLVRARGALPLLPHYDGEFLLDITQYAGDRGRWWIMPNTKMYPANRVIGEVADLW